ncbi:surface lipoprotein assembly modifier [Vibrio splendidus]
MKLNLPQRLFLPLISFVAIPSALVSLPSVASNPDTSLRIEQQDALSAVEKENAILAEEMQDEEQRQNAQQSSSNLIDPSIADPESTFSIDLSDSNQVAQALHLSAQQHNWGLAQQLLSHYQLFDNADPLLIHYVRGGIYRSQGDLKRAQEEYTQLITLQPNFMPAQLELARVLFENHNNSESLELFEQIEASLPSNNPRTQGVQRTIDVFSSALKARDDWGGSISFGPSFNDNLNSSSESYTCLVHSDIGQCIIDRVTPKKQQAFGIDYEASLNKRTSLTGHHGVSFSGLTYGTRYSGHDEYDEQTVKASFGYSYQSQRDRVSFAPQFEFNTFAGKSLYLSSGIKLDWFKTVNKQSAFKFETKADYQNYQPGKLDYQSDWQFSTLFTYWYQLPDKWLLFGGLDWTDKRNDQQVHAYTLSGVRLGVNKNVSTWLDVSLFASLRDRRYQDFSALLGDKRNDREQNYTLVIHSPSIQYLGVSPTLSWTHKRVKSNIDWLYTYQQNEIGLKLTKRF